MGSSDTANPLAVTSASLNGGFIGNALGAAKLSGASATFSSLIIAIGTSAPTVSAIADNGTGLASGSTAGNRPVTITGTNFAGATGVTIGGVPAVGVVVVNSNTITCRTGPHAAGLVSIAVTTPSGTGANTLYYNLVDGAGTTLTLPTNGGASATWGFSTLSFQDEFNDLLSVQVNASDNSGSNYVTPAPGYNWYTQNFGWANTKFMGSFQDWLNGGNTDFVNPAYQFYLLQYFSVVSSVLTMVGHRYLQTLDRSRRGGERQEGRRPLDWWRQTQASEGDHDHGELRQTTVALSRRSFRRSIRVPVLACAAFSISA